MSGTVMKRVGVALAVTMASTLVLVMLAAALVMNGVLTMEQVPLWGLRIMSLAAGVGVVMMRKRSKSRRKRRRRSAKGNRKRSVT